MRHYHLYHDGEYHYVGKHFIIIIILVVIGNIGEKLFDSVEDVVADGLITLFMEKHNADKYLQTQRSSLVTIQHGLGGRSPSSSNGIGSTLTPIAEQDVTLDHDQQAKDLPIANGFGADPLATLVPRTLSTSDPLKSPDNESVVSDSQVCFVYSCIALYILVYYCIPFHIIAHSCIFYRLPAYW